MRDLRVNQMPMPRSGARPDRLRAAWAGSAVAHVLALLIIVFVRLMEPIPPPPEPPSMAIEFEPDTTQTAGGPKPSKTTETPKGPTAALMHPAQTEPPATAASQPQMNLIPPEYMQPPPPPQQEEAEPIPPPMLRPRYSQTGPSKSNDRNPFAHPMNFSLAPHGARSEAAGLQNSRSMDLSAGPVIRGGRLVDSVAHVVGQGGRGDYLALLSEFIETHKYYPEGAAANGEEGSATVALTVLRDGTVKALHLESSTGSSLLDSAWMAVFRDNQLPAFTDDMPGAQETFKLTLNYELIYRH